MIWKWNYLYRLLLFPLLITLSACFGGSPPSVKSEADSRAALSLARAIRAESKGDLRLAETLLMESLNISSSIENNPAKAKALINLARLSRSQDDMVKATNYIDAAIAIPSQNSEIISELYHEKAAIELSIGNKSSAQSWAERSVANEKGADLGRRLNLLGRIMLAKGDTVNATAVYKRAFAENKGGAQKEEEANSLRMLGVLARIDKQYDVAEGLMTQALEIDKSLGLSAKIALDLEELANTASSANKLELAAKYLDRASAVNLNAGRTMRAATNLLARAEILNQLGDTRNSEVERNKAYDLLKKKRD